MSIDHFLIHSPYVEPLIQENMTYIYPDNNDKIVVEFVLNHKETTITFDVEEIDELAHLIKSFGLTNVNLVKKQHIHPWEQDQMTMVGRAFLRAFQEN
jgi:hypothetical protein